MSDASLTCSAKACREMATWALLWNNPKVHTPDRRKVWLACDEHRVTLGDFLSLRGFLRATVPVDDIPADAG
ncbi:hypothetical protein N803_08390 [Knoellia subterranea KCTC 19937]|uniref:Acetone carboxylase n=2 Tax=Knoellia TaxID=136099 RepID=A0A0A0JRQ0_9MICO|nr:hypothetical protein N803_08390 [Knoellia subterranea KCTC 19937]